MVWRGDLGSCVHDGWMVGASDYVIIGFLLRTIFFGEGGSCDSFHGFVRKLDQGLF